MRNFHFFVTFIDSVIFFNDSMVKFRHITQIPICANYMSFERARRAESNGTKIKDWSKLWAEIQVPEFQKRGGGE